MKTIAVLLFTAAAMLAGCDDTPSSDQTQTSQQETLLKEATSQVGMPAIKNFRERKLLKDIYELRDQTGLTTFTYVFNELKGCAVLVGTTVGYGIPYSTQFTNPQKIEWYRSQTGIAVLPQADPNGLFSPTSSEGTWVLLKDPNGDTVKPVYIEPRIISSPFKLTGPLVCN